MRNTFKIALLGSIVALILTACGESAEEVKAAATAPVTAATTAATTAVNNAANTATNAVATTANTVASTASNVAAAVTKDKNGCIAYPKAEWMSEADAKTKLTELGYKAKTFEVSGNCYEMYGFDKDGKKIEVYFDAKTMAIVKKGS